MPVIGTVVIDPGHGGTSSVGGSSANNATSPSGVKEKDLTLDIAFRLRAALAADAPRVNVLMTRSADTNLSLEDRAGTAKLNAASLLLSIHFNGFNGAARGVETLVRSKANGNVNHQEDLEFAQRVQSKVLAAVRARDAGTKDRGVKEMALGVLRDDYLGNTMAYHPCRACLVEIEFMDVPAVDQLLNTGPDAGAVRNEIAAALKAAIVEQLLS